MKLYWSVLLCLLFACVQESKNDEHSQPDIPNQHVKYAQGFDWEDQGQLKILIVNSPWPESDKVYKYVLVNRAQAAAMTFDRDAYDGIILTPVEKIVVTSTTHLPPIEMLGESEALVGFPGTDYISSPIFREKVENNTVKELGKNEKINTEIILETNPEVIVGFGVNGTNNTFNLIESSGIPVLYNGDWVETSPLAKAEWIKFFGLLFEKVDTADLIFNKIESDYIQAKNSIPKDIKRPTALSGALHKDVWYLPSGNSTEAQFFQDAGINYLWSGSKGKGSLSLSIESVLEKAEKADLWFSPSYYGSKDALLDANNHYQQFQAFKQNNIYSFVNTTGETGGVLYYELGVARPDLVLKDLIKIAYPEALPNYSNRFFKKLN